MRKKVLITGGAGFIGSHTVDKFIAEGYDIVVVDNLSTGKIENLNKKAKFYNCDITSEDLKNIFNVERPDYVVHLAAQICVPNATKEPLYDAKINILGSINVLENSKNYGVKKIVASSSAAVYGKPNYLPVDEKHTTEPLSNYGISKLSMEKYIELSGLNYIIFRFSNVYGERQTPNGEAGVVTIFENAMKNNLPITIYGDGKQIRDFVYVKDIANTVYQITISNIQNEIINISTNNGISINQLFNSLSKKYNYNISPLYKEVRKGDIKDSILDNKKLQSFIQYNFQQNI